ncbi:zinc finger C2H2-like protein [Dichotomopilus funicola]|uniref:Zinc finger C2H2-like protein n=1 Tax=Dichotomopilus funicola TaxID=1934379 RepID=A0AAN6UU36_9PEZI|nr:zinc finger C2H2-like protein [Dichotomopilus funicola]
MSNFPQHRAMHDAGTFTAPAIHGAHNHGSHAHAHGHLHPQSAMTGQYAPCPYEDKVTKDGTTARMVLLFLRELLDQLSVAEQPQQSYGCPMTRCHRSFVAPLQVIQHLLSCPELANGEFDCDKCCTSHSFPTNEKDWSQWMGWRSQQCLQIQRKRSLGSKMKDFALRKKDPSRKQNPAFDSHFKNASAMDTRPSTATSDAPSTTFTNRGFQQHVGFPGQHGQGPHLPGFADLHKSGVPSDLPEVDSHMFWHGFNNSASGLPSTVSSIALSSMDDNPSERLSQNTSQSTLFNPPLGHYQSPGSSSQAPDGISASQQPYMFPTQMSFDHGLTSLPGHAPASSAMCIDNPLPLPRSPISPADPRSPASNSSSSWWRPKVEADTSRPTPPTSGPDSHFPLSTGIIDALPSGVNSGLTSPTSPNAAGSPYYQLQSQTTQSMSRALSQESMEGSMPTTFGTPIPERSGSGSLTPRAESQPQHTHQHQHVHQHSHAGSTPGKPSTESSIEDLVCDECQWKPRGVRENLKGYLRKHKNTHKGVRLACDIPGCVKTFSRLDNLKKHKKDKHGIEDTGGSIPAKRVAGDMSETGEPDAEVKRPATVESEIRGVTEDYSMLWPALHF